MLTETSRPRLIQRYLSKSPAIVEANGVFLGIKISGASEGASGCHRLSHRYSAIHRVAPFTKGIDRESARAGVTISGDKAIAEPIFRLVAIAG